MLLNEYSVAFLLINASLFFFLSRRWALLPLLVTACYMTRAQGILLGPFHFSIIRLILFAGFVRAILRGERLNRRLNGMDRLMLVWAIWLLASSFFHKDVSSAIVYRLGIVYDVCGLYFLVCVFCQSIDDLVQLCKMVALILVPIAVEMLCENIAVYNVFSNLGGVAEIPYIREGKVRAQGPFSHAILAGSVGAVCLPMTISIWRLNRKVAVTGTVACLLMVYASASSGPTMSTLAGIFGLLVWKFREKAKGILWLLIIGYIALNVVMNDPAYYIMARIDITGGSTGWHRARLIQSSIEHLSEWWIAGTDYTRHWMPTGVSWSPEHSDITNHYIQMGIWGGLPLFTLFIAQLVNGFIYVGAAVRHWTELSLQVFPRFVIWALGASLFAHAATCTSVSYFDQSYIFLYITLAAISSAWSQTKSSTATHTAIDDERHSAGAEIRAREAR